MIWAYNKQGCKKSGTTVVSCWIIDHREYFHIAPSGTIWHIWSGASSWKEMPNGGRADDTAGCTYEASGNGDGVLVRVGSTLWYSHQNNSPANVWYGWYRW